ncbi:MAG TPA: sodium/solute symporter [Anaerohalosphaeraceae bacterium]|nr:sodium/solute symporter [Phycisphaerae bacterium]HOL31025.1 sodium/solute symporter [Anaerohalosphaeraceae bacterium]HPC63541.1 sodium/solute symporter [Anaerohalosphaeraceae bacterium]HPO70423.1 sodium/solute symporter [Anaerohalosphaeraceae bacterium]HRS70700.1 sodium/solute symporter [Anaerohalosphaeraceae bacterium]
MIKLPAILAVGVKLSPLDVWVFVLYLFILLSIGAFVSYRQRNSEDLFLGGRSMGWANVGLSIFGTNIGPTFLIATCGAGYTTGMVTANFEWMAWIFLFLLGMVFVPFYLNTKIATMPEFMNKRFGPGCYTFMSFYALLGTVVLWIGGTLFAGGALLSQLLGWKLMLCIWLLAAVAASFTITGGLVAVMVTDSFQSILMILGAALLAVITASQLESFSALLHVQCGSTPSELTWKLLHPAGSENPWYAFVLGYPVLSLWFWCSDQTIVQRALGAKNLKQSQGGTLFAAFLKIIPPFIFLLPGIFAAQLLPDIKDDKQVFLSLVSTYLPAGLVGLIVSVLVAAVISTLDSGLNSFSTIFTLDIYKRWIAPTASEHQIKQIGRITTLFSTLLAVWIALFLSKAEGTNLFNLFQGIIGYMAPPVSAVFVLGIFWRRSTATAALLTLIVGSLISLVIGFCDITNIFANEAGEDIFPHFLLLSFYLFCSILVFMIAASLLTQHSISETPLPTLAQTYRQNPGLGPVGLAGWILLAVIMVGLYLFFQYGMKAS